MGLEVATHISQLVTTNPVGGVDPVSQGDDHIRLLKSVLTTDFPNINAVMSASAAELNYMVGVTSNVQTQLNTKLASSSYTAADVLAKLLTVDGAGSGLDADLLDGQSSAYYLPASSYTAADVLAKLLTVDGTGTGLDADLLDGLNSSAFLLASSYTAADVFAKVLTLDGAGTGLDADLLDGQQGSYYLPAGSYTAADVLAKLLTVDGSGSGIDADLLDGLSSASFLRTTNNLSDVSNTATALSNLGGVPTSRSVSVSGTGLTGGGDLSANRTITIDQTAMTTRNISAKTGVTKTLSSSTPSGGSDGDIWYKY